MKNNTHKNILVGVFILAVILSLAYFTLLDRPSEDNALTNSDKTNTVSNIPIYLQGLFSDTDWSKSNPDLKDALSGGPTKDGIPALDNPKFISLSESDYTGDMQAIVIKGTSETKVYPYGIMTWHEIVNDTVDDTPVAITFCPLCGSAIVYNRTLPTEEVSTFGVSGSLLESNMIMYDRATENLWQQSTGKVLAGSHFPAQLKLVPFQLMTIGEAQESYPAAVVLSKDTGHGRNYDRNPYSGYETNNQFVFEPSAIDATFPPKTIMAVFRTVNETPVTVPWLALREAGMTSTTIDGMTYSLVVSNNGEMVISDSDGNSYPFYFEMWFSFAVQHGDKAIVIET
ncbi:MAG: DUF3179 domain-containing protein [Candidatus Pacebacteria bacterium]|nr:DUF3179 domain-containing protein [Candidatus Paceibacterota bacterium]